MSVNPGGPTRQGPGVRPRSRTRVAALTLLGLLAACSDSPTTVRESSPAYDPRVVVEVEPGLVRYAVYHWRIGSNIRVYVDPTAASGGSDLRGAVVDGAARWREAIREGEFSVSIASDPRQADVIVHYGEAPRLVGPGDCAPPSGAGVGATFFCPDFSFSSLQVLPLLAGGPGTVKMDIAVYRSRVADEVQFRRAVAHELGHMLGIGTHSPSAADLMFAAPTVDAPSGADAKTLRYVLQQTADLTP